MGGDKDLLERLRECTNIINLEIKKLIPFHDDTTDPYRDGERRGQILAYEKVLRILYSRIPELSKKG